ncbi:MAG: MFS transporter [Acidimicrobiales bacterium]|nr:MFS transporter [Acidimicrobiales bacterium]
MLQRWRLDLSAVLLYFALGAMFSAVPRYVHEDLGGTRALSGFSVSVFFLAAVLTRPIAGRMVDRYGGRPCILGGSLLVALGMVAMTAATAIPAVLALRFTQGVAGSAFYVAAVTASTDIAGPARRASAVSQLSFAIYLGFALGPAVGERLADIGFKAAWLALGAVAAIASAVAVSVPETRPVSGRERTLRSTGYRFGFLHPVAVLPGLTLLALGVGYVSVTSQSALYARAVGIGSSSSLFGAYAITILVVRLVAGRLADRIGPVNVMFPGMAALVSGCSVWSLVQSPVSAYAGAVLIGAGWALVFPALTAWLAARVSDAERGAAIGSLVAFMDAGQGMGGYAVGAIADRFGFGWAFALPAALALCGTVVLMLAVRRYRDEYRAGAFAAADTAP